MVERDGVFLRHIDTTRCLLDGDFHGVGWDKMRRIWLELMMGRRTGGGGFALKSCSI